MGTPQATTSRQAFLLRLGRLGAGYLAILAVTLLFGLGMAWRPGRYQHIQDRLGESQVALVADRAVAIWPFDCTQVTWQVDNVNRVYFNGDGVNGAGERVICGQDDAVFEIVFPDTSTRVYPLERLALAQPAVIACLVLSAVFLALIEVARRRRLPAVAWVLGGFATAYVVFFVIPTFLASQMKFPEYIPVGPITGYDLKQFLQYSAGWALGDGSPYVGTNNHPPLMAVLFAPLLFMPFDTAHAIMTGVTLVGYAAIALLFPLAASARRQLSPILTLIFAAGAVSYGFQFELERTQFNILSMFLCLSAVYLFHFHRKLRLLAYVLFVISVQLKIYPLIFIVLLVEDWSAWKVNIRRFAALLAVNVAGLFALGLRVFNDFVNAVSHYSEQPPIWQGNNSITSFTALLPRFGLDFPGEATLVPAILLATFAGCFGLVWWRAYRRNTGRPDPYLLLVCTIGAIIVPAVSHDYKLSILAPGVALVLDAAASNPLERPRLWLWQHILIFALAVCYSFTLFSYVTRSGIFTDNLPALLTILIAGTLLAALPRPAPDAELAAP